MCGILLDAWKTSSRYSGASERARVWSTPSNTPLADVARNLTSGLKSCRRPLGSALRVSCSSTNRVLCATLFIVQPIDGLSYWMAL